MIRAISPRFGHTVLIEDRITKKDDLQTSFVSQYMQSVPEAPYHNVYNSEQFSVVTDLNLKEPATLPFMESLMQAARKNGRIAVDLDVNYGKNDVEGNAFASHTERLRAVMKALTRMNTEPLRQKDKSL